MRNFFLFVVTLVSLSANMYAAAPQRKTFVSIEGESFCINGMPTFKGKTWREYPIEGLLPNSRMVNGIFDDETDSTRYRWVYPDTKVWDAERNTREFVENMSLWRKNGLLAFTINLQGGSPQGYSGAQPWKNTALDEKGNLKPAYMNRLTKILDKADELGMVVILGIYYFGQEKNITDEAAVFNGARNTVEWIIKSGYTNIIIEINNECDLYKVHPVLTDKRVHELIRYVKNMEINGRRLLVGTSYKGGAIPGSEVIKASDFILLHGNGVSKPERIVEMVHQTKQVEGYTPKPIIFNEDDHFDFDKPMNNFVAATSVGASWGYFDFRNPDEPFETGFQCIPADWGINSERKKGFFNLLSQWCEGYVWEKAPNQIMIVKPSSEGTLDFAAQEITSAGKEAGMRVLVQRSSRANANQTILIHLLSTAEASAKEIASNQLRPMLYNSEESYSIRCKYKKTGLIIWVLASDPVGAMYGGLDVAEMIRNNQLDRVKDSDQKPYIANRGIKFNLPLDLRTPSYSDISDAFQQNIPVVWDMEFWKKQFDEMARNRYNTITLWTLQAFPAMVKVPEFPDISLNDVWRTKHKPVKQYSSLGIGLIDDDLMSNYEVLKKITIDQKIAFWRQVMAYAKSRGIKTYLFTWNIFTYGIDGKYGITDSRDNEMTIKYYRAATREFILTYPDLAGIGITAGENMQPSNRNLKVGIEEWLWKTYGEGINDALAKQPNRKFNLIHRFHFTAMNSILEEFKDLKAPLQFSLKYSVAHMHSIVNPPFVLPAMPHFNENRQTWFTVRNDDYYAIRWGSEDYARAYIKSMPGVAENKLAGFYMGPDGYCWGKDFLAKDDNPARQLIIDKQWYSFMLYGRLAYNPDLPSETFSNAINRHYPNLDTETLLRAWDAASMIFPWATRQIWGDIDLKWWPEACWSSPTEYKGFITVKDVVEIEPVSGSNIINISRWAQEYYSGERTGLISPIQVADTLEYYARKASFYLDRLPKRTLGSFSQSDQLLGDIELFMIIGRYYARKIRAAAYIALYNYHGIEDDKETALNLITKAQDDWTSYSTLYDSKYKSALYNRLGVVDVIAIRENVKKDIEIVRNWKVGDIEKYIISTRTEMPFRQ